MRNKSKIGNLEQRKKELADAIEHTRRLKASLMTYIDSLEAAYEAGSISYREFRDAQRRALKNHTRQQWVKYYDDCIRFYEAEWRTCEESAASAAKRTSIIGLTILVLLILGGIGGLGLLAMNSTVDLGDFIGRAIDPPIPEDALTILKERTPFGERVTISSNPPQQDVVVNMTIPETAIENIRFYRIVNGTRVAYPFTTVDTNGNGLIDTLEWTSAESANDTYEVELIILDVQSYPIVGGNWTVHFNTTGTAELWIRAVNGTTWSDNNDENQLRLLEITCGDTEQEHLWINGSAYIRNYSCSSIGLETSKVLQAGVHTLEFQFGNIVRYAYNDATNRPQINTIVLNATRAINHTNDNLTVYVNATDADGDTIKSIYDWRISGKSTHTLIAPFEGGSNATFTRDYTANGNNGTVSEAVWSGASGFDGRGAYTFDAINDNIQMTDSPSLNITGSELTIAAWVKPRGTTTRQIVARASGTLATQRQYGLYLTTANALGFETRTTGARIDVAKGSVPNDVWTFVAGTYDGFRMTWYINGVPVGTETQSGTITHQASNLHIGQFPGGVSLFNGTIDDVTIMNISLSGGQIYALYNNRTDRIVQQETSVGDNWSLAATPNDGFVDGDTVASNSLVITNTLPTASITINISTTQNRTQDDITANATLADTDGDTVKPIYVWRANGAPITVLHMPFERINDTSINNTWDYARNHHATATTARWNGTAGYDGNGAYELDGIDDVINIPTNTDFDVSSGTVVFWMRSNGSWQTNGGDSLNRATIFSRSNANSCAGMHIQQYPAGNISVLAYVPGTCSGIPTTVIESTRRLADDKWHMIAVSYERHRGGRMVLYIDGTQEGNKTNGAAWAFNNQQIFIGDDADVFWEEWNGTIDEVQWYNRTLSAEQILKLNNSRQDMIVGAETTAGDIWNVRVYPQDGYENGVSALSNDIEILVNAPAISSLVLNATSSLNVTNDNLTAFTTTTDADNDVVRVIYNWLINGATWTILNMPFEKVNDTVTDNAYDYSGRAHHATSAPTAIAPVWSTNGINGSGAYTFDGVDDQLNISKSADFDMVNGTITFWTRTSGLWTTDGGDSLNRASILGRNDASASCNGLIILQLPAGNITVVAYGTGCGGLPTANVTSTRQIADGNLHFVAVTYNRTIGGTIALYIDGVHEKNTTNAAGWSFNNQSVTMGSNADTFWEQWNGTLDQLQWYNRILSPEQIQALHSNRTDLIVSQETSVGENWTVQAIPNDGYVDGSGASATIQIQDLSAGIALTDSAINFGGGYYNASCTNGFAVLNSNTSRTCWVNTSAFPTTTDFHRIENTGNTIVNVTIHAYNLNDAEQLFCGFSQGCTGSTSAQVRVKSINNEASSCAAANLTTDFESILTHNTNATVGLCDSLDFTDASDSIDLQLELQVPHDTRFGTKTLTLVYEAIAV